MNVATIYQTLDTVQPERFSRFMYIFMGLIDYKDVGLDSSERSLLDFQIFVFS